MPSAETYRKLVEMGIGVDKCPYATNDALASERDMEDLFSVLTEFKDVNGGHPSITANTVMMNPDYTRIRDSGFKEYIGEPFTEALKRYPEHARSFTLWGQGMSQGIFYPQFHGREHLNVRRWMNLLQNCDSVYRTVFEEEMFWPGSAETKEGDLSIRAAFDTDDLIELDHHREILRDGLQQFEELFGYKSESFIAPNFVCHPDLYETLAGNGVEVIQGMKYQKLPVAGNDKREMIRRIQGQMNELSQINLVRNCVFEPSQKPENHDSVGECLKGIENAFLWKKPAVITAHRLNFIGYIHPENREKNLAQFRELLSKMVKRWPDIEFMTSVELGNVIRSNNTG